MSCIQCEELRPIYSTVEACQRHMNKILSDTIDKLQGLGESVRNEQMLFHGECSLVLGDIDQLKEYIKKAIVVVEPNTIPACKD